MLDTVELFVAVAFTFILTFEPPFSVSLTVCPYLTVVSSPVESLIKLLSKQWCTVNDIMKICNVGMNKAVEIRTELKERITKEGYLVPNNLIPTSEIIKAFNIDLDYLERMAKLQ